MDRRDRRDAIAVMSHGSSVTCSFCLTKVEPTVALSEIVGASSPMVDVELRVPGFGLVVTVAT